jgi:sulfide dehydrogenase [flavocytochrome c] flavoprotein chain
MKCSRRQFLLGTLVAPLATLPARARGQARVVVIGGGYAGATAARYLRAWSGGALTVTLVDPLLQFISCPLSNRVIAGFATLSELTFSREMLAQHWGVQLVTDRAVDIDPVARRITLAAGDSLAYDRLVIAPGLRFRYDTLPGLAGEEAQAAVPHAWKAGAQTTILHRQLATMPDGGVCAICIPPAPYRCPPGPYERASLIADFCRRHKPRAKVLVLDANPHIQSKEALFRQAWQEAYADIIEYHPDSRLLDVDASSRTAILEFERVRADVLNVIPPQGADDIAARSGARLVDGNWIDVNWLDMSARGVADLHILGDATLAAPGMPKSAHMANQHAKIAAAAIVAELAGAAPDPLPIFTNTCYSFTERDKAMHVAAVYRYDPQRGVPLAVPGAGGLSTVSNEEEGKIALAWAHGILQDTLGG